MFSWLRKKKPVIEVDNDDMFFFVYVNGKEVYRTEESYKAYLFATELKIKFNLL